MINLEALETRLEIWITEKLDAQDYKVSRVFIYFLGNGAGTGVIALEFRMLAALL